MPELLMVICSLLGVIGLIFLVYYGTRWLNKKFRSTGWNGLERGIKIIDCIGIAQDKQLMVVKVGKKGMLLGVAPNSISKLCDIDDDDISDMQRETEEKSSVSFSESLKNAFFKNNNAENGSVQEDGKENNEKNDL
ncbi:MAG: FliO/MopB family protein [Oscillospiraceae bacterium]